MSGASQEAINTSNNKNNRPLEKKELLKTKEELVGEIRNFFDDVRQKSTMTALATTKSSFFSRLKGILPKKNESDKNKDLKQVISSGITPHSIRLLDKQYDEVKYIYELLNELSKRPQEAICNIISLKKEELPEDPKIAPFPKPEQENKNKKQDTPKLELKIQNGTMNVYGVDKALREIMDYVIFQNALEQLLSKEEIYALNTVKDQKGITIEYSDAKKVLVGKKLIPASDLIISNKDKDRQIGWLDHNNHTLHITKIPNTNIETTQQGVYQILTSIALVLDLLK